MQIIKKYLDWNRRKLAMLDIPDKVKENIGNETFIGNDVKIYKSSVCIGNYTYVNGGKIFYAKIGKFCSIGYGVYIGSGEHYINKVTTFPLKNRVGGIKGFIDFPEQKNSIIGNDVWIGNNVIIKQGVRIGDGAIIGSGAVVTKDVEPYSILVGVPARILKKRFDDEIIKELLKIRWWDWEISKIKEVSINNGFDDIELFVKNYNQG